MANKTFVGTGGVPIVVVLTSGTSWAVPPDCTSLDSVECIGSGGNGAGAALNAAASGGGGGEYRSIVNLAVTPNSSITYQIGAAGSPSDTWFKTTGTVLAKKGANGVTGGNQTGGAGGTGGTGTTAHNGGAGGNSTLTAGGGGGGPGTASGTGGTGSNASGTTGGAGGAVGGGAGGNTLTAGTAGGVGAGAGGSGSTVATVANGGRGQITITYTATDDGDMDDDNQWSPVGKPIMTDTVVDITAPIDLGTCVAPVTGCSSTINGGTFQSTFANTAGNIQGAATFNGNVTDSSGITPGQSGTPVFNAGYHWANGSACNFQNDGGSANFNGDTVFDNTVFLDSSVNFGNASSFRFSSGTILYASHNTLNPGSTDPGIAKVEIGTTYSVNGTPFTGTLNYLAPRPTDTAWSSTPQGQILITPVP